jgi:cell volume regulation protein A
LHHDAVILLTTGALLAAALLVSQLANRVRMPGLLLVLGIGMAVGSDGLGWIDFGDYELARTIGIIALAFILYEGGLASGFQEIRPVLRPGIALATVGTLITALFTGLAAMWLFDLPWLEGLLIGAAVSSSDGAAIFALLRGSTLRRRVARTLEAEAGLNDPVAILLVLGVIEFIKNPSWGMDDMLKMFVVDFGLGAVIGLGVGFLAVKGLARLRPHSAGLWPVASLAVALLSFGGAEAAGGSGFLAVYLTGLTLGSAELPGKRTMASFQDGVGWISQLALFLTLGLLVFPAQLGDVALSGTLLALFLVAVARPLAVLVATVGSGFSLPERFVLGWAGLRGAVPVVLATFAVIEGVEGSREFFNIVFFAVLISTLLQATTFEAVAKWLGVTTTEPAITPPLIEPSVARAMGAEVMAYRVDPGDAVAGRRVRELGMPRDALLNLIIRGEQAIPPRGSTRVEPGDVLHMLIRQEAAPDFAGLVRRWRVGPLPSMERPRPRPGRIPVFSSGPWTGDENPSRPQTLRGVSSVAQLRTRRDRPGAVIALEDGSVAFTGPVWAKGSVAAVQDAARRELVHSEDEADRTWWREVIGALAQP